MTTVEQTEFADEVPGAGAGTGHEAAVPVIEHAEPTSGGSFMRNLDTGELIKTAGPALDDQPSKE